MRTVILRGNAEKASERVQMRVDAEWEEDCMRKAGKSAYGQAEMSPTVCIYGRKCIQ